MSQQLTVCERFVKCTLCCLHYVTMASRCYAGTSIGIADVPWHPFIIEKAFSDFSCWQNTVCVTCKMSVLQAVMKIKHTNMDFLEHYSIMKWKDISEVLNIKRETLFCGPWGHPSLALSACVCLLSAKYDLWFFCASCLPEGSLPQKKSV